MRIEEIMTRNPTCCTPNTRLGDVARMMAECDCGEIPVVDNEQERRPIGVITDRDIVCRTVARGRNPLDLFARDCMTTPAVTIMQSATVEECCRLMELRQIRRIPVVDQNGRCCGIVAQADLARHLSTQHIAGVVRQVSVGGPSPAGVPPA
jgi:CBS domain-containing protein